MVMYIAGMNPLSMKTLTGIVKTARRDNSIFSSDTPTGIVMQRRKQRIHSHCVRYNRYEEDLLHTLAWSSDDIVEHRLRLLDECGLWFEREDTHLIFFLPYGWLSVLVPNPMQTKNRILSALLQFLTRHQFNWILVRESRKVK